MGLCIRERILSQLLIPNSVVIHLLNLSLSLFIYIYIYMSTLEDIEEEAEDDIGFYRREIRKLMQR